MRRLLSTHSTLYIIKKTDTCIKKRSIFLLNKKNSHIFAS
ncbi:hypothetical protein EVA_03743 [gut metagenome]|uniref:Uncharacterized protein n=1 Tax=gut metagenome TaxID=749906 RepID=J9GL75_9ZZZZ